MKADLPATGSGHLEDLVGCVADEFTQRLNRGEQPDVEEYVERHPEIAEALRQVLPALVFMRLTPQAFSEDASGAGQERGRLGDFCIRREIGRGGMGIVYEAEQISLQRRVALKVLPFAATMDPRQQQRFKNEALAAASLEHPHIVPVYGVGCERGVHYYAMRLIDGRSLAELLPRWRPDNVSGSADSQAETTVRAAASTKPATRDAADVRKVAEWGIQAAEALEHAHSLGIVHRDIKPANLLIDGQGKLWVTDFGLARVAADAGLTMTGDLVGTLRYMSPEQALAKHGLVDHRTDVYSLGVTLYELLTLVPAVLGDDRQELLRQIGDEEPRPLRRINSAIPSDLETIVFKAMAKGPAERYSTARELADDLRRFLEYQPIRARRAGATLRLQKWVRRHQAVTVAACAGLLVTVVVLACSSFLLWREKEQVKQALADKEQEQRRAEANFDKVLNGMPDEVMREIYDEKWSHLPEIAAIRHALSSRLERAYLNIKEKNRDDPMLRLQAGWLCQNLGEFHLARWEYARAEALFLRAVAIHDELTAAHPEDAEQVYWHAQALYRVGRVLHASGLPKEARPYFLRSRKQYQTQIRLLPGWRAHSDLGYFLSCCPDEELIDLDEALRLIARAVELNPEAPSIWFNLARVQFRVGKWEDALASLHQVVQRDREGYAGTYYCLAMTCCRLGEKDQARAYLDQGDRLVIEKQGGVTKYGVQLLRDEAAALLDVREDPKPGLRLPPRPKSSPP